jgi:hypothetical protein
MLQETIAFENASTVMFFPNGSDCQSTTASLTTALYAFSRQQGCSRPFRYCSNTFVGNMPYKQQLSLPTISGLLRNVLNVHSYRVCIESTRNGSHVIVNVVNHLRNVTIHFPIQHVNVKVIGRQLSDLSNLYAGGLYRLTRAHVEYERSSYSELHIVLHDLVIISCKCKCQLLHLRLLRFSELLRQCKNPCEFHHLHPVFIHSSFAE